MGSLMIEFPNQDVSYYEFKTRFDFSHVDIVSTEMRKDYWEGLGGSVTEKMITCQHCGKFVSVVVFGDSHICGVCGKSVH
jgi:ribosomal protein S27AE